MPNVINESAAEEGSGRPVGHADTHAGSVNTDAAEEAGELNITLFR